MVQFQILGALNGKTSNKKRKKKVYQKKKKNYIDCNRRKNKTEKTYFQEFNKHLKNCNIVFSNGNNTDPVKIVNDAINTAESKDIESENGDLLYAVFDTDFNKILQIETARKLARKNDIEIILSNPCFEIWLLLHFRYSTRGYHSNNEVLNELCNHWPEYCKNIDSFQYLQDRCKSAIENARKLKKFCLEMNGTESIECCNPSTDVYKLVTDLIKTNDS